MRAFVYVAAVTPGLCLAVCSCAPVAATRSSFAAAAIEGRSTATAAALRGHGNGPCGRYVRRTLTVLADIHELRVADGAQVSALHCRSYDRGAQIEQTEHLQALIEQKRSARQHRATDRLAQVAPASQDLLVRAAERGANLGAITNGLTRLLDRYGAADLQAAIREALDRGVPHPNAVRLALERRREQRGETPPVDIDLPANVRARDAPVQPHALETYDQLKDGDDE